MINPSVNSPFRLPGQARIFLIGFMGSGKTYWGRIWSQQFSIDFYDLDEVIEKKEGKTITAIFEKQGEEYFRKIETDTLKTFKGKERYIIACGGGTACFNDNMQWMNENGTTIYLYATPSYILSRVKEEKDKRPLIKKHNEAELLFFIEQKLKEREPFYKLAKLMLPVTKLNENSLSTINY